MSRKDYELIARAIAVQMKLFAAEPDSQEAIRSTAERIATALGMDNPRFDRARFLSACGVTNV